MRHKMTRVESAPSGALPFSCSGRLPSVRLRLLGAMLLLALGGGAMIGEAGAQEDVLATQSQVRELSQRIERIERMLDSSAMQELLRNYETMGRELRELRGEVETLGHELDRLNTRQRDQFRYLDDRLTGFEGGTAAPVDPSEEVIELDLPDADAQAAYQEAFDDLMEGNYAAATTRLERFIETYPDSAHAANAWYWLAEAKYASGDFEAALEDFTRLREQYPQSDKAGDALLKIGYAHYELGQEDAAREALETVRAEYAGTTLDRLARERLHRLDGS